MTKKVSDEQMREMQAKLAGLGITRPSKKQALKAIRKGRQNIPVEEVFNPNLGPTQHDYDPGKIATPEDPRVELAMSILAENPDMDPAEAVFQAWSGMGGRNAVGREVAETLDTLSEDGQSYPQTPPTGDSDDQA